MSCVLFVNGTAHGHINPTLPLAAELARRGETVYYCSTSEFKEKIEAVGARFLDCGPQMTDFLKSYRPSGTHPFYSLIEFLLSQDAAMVNSVPDLLKSLDIDYIVHDAMLGGGSMLARILNLPAICTCSSFAAGSLPVPPSMLQKGIDPQLDGVLRQLEEFNRSSSQQITMANVFFQKEDCNIVFTSRLFQPGGDVFDGSFCFVGPSIDEDREGGEAVPEALFSGGTIVYVSMGTINNACVSLYRNCIEAMEGIGANVIMSIGSKVDLSSLGAIPPGFQIYSHVPQLAVLRRASAFISHGGLNSVSEALYYGVPVVAIPQANDQPAVARRLAELGAGLELKAGEATPGRIREAVEALLSDGSYRSACQRVRESFRQAGGYRAAADRIIAYKETLGIG